MSRLTIEEGIVINELENTMEAIRTITGKAGEPETMKRFINQEKATKFYIDKKMNTQLEAGADSSYLWLDTGYSDKRHNPVFICLHKSGNMYEGHYTGIAETLKNRIRLYNNSNVSVIEKNYSRFLDKYKKRTINRIHKEIMDEASYILDVVNQDNGETELSRKLKELNLVFGENNVSSKRDEIFLLKKMREEKEQEKEHRQEQFTIGFLMERIEKQENYIEHLLKVIEEHEETSESQIKELKEENEANKSAMLQIRIFMEEEQKAAESRSLEAQKSVSAWNGHNLLPKNGKILVLGDTCIGSDVMLGIAKQFGFTKLDFEFQRDYKRIVSVSKRVHNSTRYAAVIFGKLPHKVAGIGAWSGIIEEFKQTGICDCPIEARNLSGDLKVTKESFRKALIQLCEKMTKICA